MRNWTFTGKPGVMLDAPLLLRTLLAIVDGLLPCIGSSAMFQDDRKPRVVGFLYRRQLWCKPRPVVVLAPEFNAGYRSTRPWHDGFISAVTAEPVHQPAAQQLSRVL